MVNTDTKIGRLVIVLLVLTFPLWFILFFCLWFIWSIFTILFAIVWFVCIEPTLWVINGGDFGSGYQNLIKKFYLLEVPA